VAKAKAADEFSELRLCWRVKKAGQELLPGLIGLRLNWDCRIY